MRRCFDLVVIGGGPAGTSAAITAKRLGFDVLVLEAGSFPRHKVCGEFVSGEALALLADLVGDPFLLANVPRIDKVRVFVAHAQAELPIAPAAASISRYDLDLALWSSAASAGCEVRDRSRVKAVARSENEFVIRLDSVELSARAVVNATGRWSNLTTDTRLAAEQWIGLKGHFTGSHPPQYCDLYFFDGGYCGVQPLGDRVINAAAMVKPTLAKNLGSVFNLNRGLRERSRSWTPVGNPVTTAPLIFRSPRTSEDGMLFAGDAAKFLDPFAGDGISIALHSGHMAAEALGSFLCGDCTLQDAVLEYDHAYRALVQPALNAAARLRMLQNLPSSLRTAAIACLNIPMLARAAVQTTRMRVANR